MDPAVFEDLDNWIKLSQKAKQSGEKAIKTLKFYLPTIAISLQKRTELNLKTSKKRDLRDNLAEQLYTYTKEIEALMKKIKLPAVRKNMGKIKQLKQELKKPNLPLRDHRDFSRMLAVLEIKKNDYDLLLNRLNELKIARADTEGYLDVISMQIDKIKKIADKEHEKVTILFYTHSVFMEEFMEYYTDFIEFREEARKSATTVNQKCGKFIRMLRKTRAKLEQANQLHTEVLTINRQLNKVHAFLVQKNFYALCKLIFGMKFVKKYNIVDKKL